MESQENLNDQMQIRRTKIKEIQALGERPYAQRYEISHSISESLTLTDGTENVRIAGRVTSIRHFGKLMFGHIQGYAGKIQFALQKKILGEAFDNFKKIVDIGDFVGLEGGIISTKTGEKTIDIQKWTFLSKSLRPLPEKFHGITDPEIRLRQRYLDLIMSPGVLERFKKRTRIIRVIRAFLEDNEFVEIDTPILTNKASGALARPFITHNNALDIDVFMRIAPETYLKRAIAGGFERVFEFARSFRNEGVDASHLPDFTLLEYYAAYWNYEDNMNFTEKLIKHVLLSVNNAYDLEYQGQKISFDGEWPRISLRTLLLNDCAIDIKTCGTKEDLLQQIELKNITLDEDFDKTKASRGTLIDVLYKKVSRPKIINPMFLIHHPLDLSPLARKNDQDSSVVDRFQLVVNGEELLNAYSELIDPMDQAERFKQQAEARSQGDLETMDVDYDFLKCMEFGMPPMSGWGMGIDRFVALLTDTSTLRDVVLFPLLRPE